MEYCRDSVWLTLQEAGELIEEGGLLIGTHFFRELAAKLNSSG